MLNDPPHAVDAVVVGGSYAGLSAALQLARARRRVVVIDAGSPRNRFAKTSHGFLGHDGRPPDAIAADGRAQLLAYPTVRWINGMASRAERSGKQFAITVDSAERLEARSVVIATGVADELPNVEGLAERWGTSVFHCPYCHGYELDSGRLGVIAVSPVAYHHAMLLPDWGQVTLFTNGTFTPDPDQTRELTQRGVVIETRPVVRIVETATIELAGGARVVLDGLFTQSRTQVVSAVARELDCVFDDGPLGSYIRTDALKATTTPGVFACGDAARAVGSVAMAVGDGAQAGISAHQSLIFSK